VTSQQKPEGAFILWRWGDREIDNPTILKKQLLEIESKGFSGVLTALGATRYEFVNRKVLRAVAQVSQWAKKRNIVFWLHADPRQASRTFITKTGERTQNLIVARKPEDGLSHKNPNIARVVNNRFELRYEIPRVRVAPVLQEISLHFEPSGLERAFLFQMENGIVLKDTVRDITSESSSFTNAAAGYTEVFGDVHVPEDEEWWVVAFPKFDTNLYDYAGRESNDLLCLFVENLFDACTHLDGITWGEGGNGYVVDMGRFPVSLSLYNSFQAEYDYDLRDVLYALVLKVDDKSHVSIRCDYYSLLINMVFSAQKDFYQTVHSFFEGLEMGTHQTVHVEAKQAEDLVRGSIDPWRSLGIANSTFGAIEGVADLKRHLPSLLSALVITKSLGVFSETQRAFFSLGGRKYKKGELTYLVDLMALFSVHWLAHTPREGVTGKDTSETPDYSDHPSWTNLEEINQMIDLMRKIIGFQFPEATAALAFQIETIMTIGSQDAEEIILSVNRLISRLVMEGIQLDVVSPVFLKEGHLSPEGLWINRRMYESVVFPYPEVLDPKVLEIVSLMAKFKFPILLGGSKPRFTTEGKKIPHVFPLTFDPQAKGLSSLWKGGVKPLFKVPENGLGTLIRQGEETLFLLCPKKFRGSVEGKVQYGKFSFSVPKSTRLVIFRREEKGKVEQIL